MDEPLHATQKTQRTTVCWLCDVWKGCSTHLDFNVDLCQTESKSCWEELGVNQETYIAVGCLLKPDGHNSLCVCVCERGRDKKVSSVSAHYCVCRFHFWDKYSNVNEDYCQDFAFQMPRDGRLWDCGIQYTFLNTFFFFKLHIHSYCILTKTL